MRGLYTEKVISGEIPFEQLAREILAADRKEDGGFPLREQKGDDAQRTPIDFAVEQFCDDGEGEVNRYHVYKVTLQGEPYVLKRSDAAEINVYEKFLKNQKLPAPAYFGNTKWNGRQWILIAFVEGTDLRDYTSDMALACAESLSRIANRYWQKDEVEFAQKRQDDRFERYWKRINKRAECLKGEPVLKAAYDRFLARQLSCPRTLSNGDFLPFNALYKDGKVTLVDWAFGGIMPYSLDIARMIAHGTEGRETFPFYMTESHKELFVRKVYELLTDKPGYEQYLEDIRLAVLNEYIEFIESDLNDSAQARDAVFDYYYTHALRLAEEML